jgi:hypothetical protein
MFDTAYNRMISQRVAEINNSFVRRVGAGRAGALENAHVAQASAAVKVDPKHVILKELHLAQHGGSMSGGRKIGGAWYDWLNPIHDLGVAANVVGDVAGDAIHGVSDLVSGSGKKRRGRPSKKGSAMPNVPTIEQMDKEIFSGFGKQSKAKARGAMVSKIMKEKGVSLGEASKMLKKSGGAMSAGAMSAGAMSAGAKKYKKMKGGAWYDIFNPIHDIKSLAGTAIGAVGDVVDDIAGGKRKRGRPSKKGGAMSAGAMSAGAMSAGAMSAGAKSKAKVRGEMVSKIMKEKGVSLGEASKMLKKSGGAMSAGAMSAGAMSAGKRKRKVGAGPNRLDPATLLDLGLEFL